NSRRASNRSISLSWFISMGGYLDAIPEVNHRHIGSQCADLFFSEMFAQRSAQRAVICAWLQTRQGLGPCQGGAFGLREIVDIPPDQKVMQTLMGFAIRECFLDVQLYTMRASIDLRSTQQNQMVKRAF